MFFFFFHKLTRKEKLLKLLYVNYFSREAMILSEQTLQRLSEHNALEWETGRTKLKFFKLVKLIHFPLISTDYAGFYNNISSILLYTTLSRDHWH